MQLIVQSMDAQWAFAHARGTRMSAGPFERRFVVGRDPTADVQLTGPEAELHFVSRHHLVLDFAGGRWFATSIGRYGWEVAPSRDRRLRAGASDVPYPVMDGMRLRVPDPDRLPSAVRPSSRPLIALSLDMSYVDERETPGDAPGEHDGSRRSSVEVWERDPELHRIAIQLLRLRHDMPSADQLQLELGLSHGTLYNRLAALERHLGITYDPQHSGGRSKAVFLADALAADGVYGALATPSSVTMGRRP